MRKSTIITSCVLVLIITLGAFLRLWQLDSSPKGALIDELHFGYIGYSLLTTGADEHGERYPLVFEGFGDSKLPAMAYLSMLGVWLFDVSILAFRFPSAVAGILLIPVGFLLSYLIFRNSLISLFGATIVALSPWTIFLSRFGFESNIALLFFMTGIALFLLGQKFDAHRGTVYAIAGVLFALSWYAYIPYRPVTLALVGLLTLTEWFKLKKQILFDSFRFFPIAFIVLIIPLLMPSTMDANSTRISQVGIFSDPSITAVLNEKRTFCDMNYPRFWCDIVWNKPVYIGTQSAFRYMSSFSLDYLFRSGETHTPFLTVDGFGQFFPILALFWIGGLGVVLTNKNSLSTHEKVLFISGLILAPIPAALVGDPQKVRLSVLFPFALVVILVGVYKFSKLLKSRLVLSSLIVGVIGMMLASSFFYFFEFHAINNIQHEQRYQSYLPSLHNYLSQLPENSVVNIYPFYSDPLMFHAFYTKMKVERYRSQVVLAEPDDYGFRHAVELGSLYAYRLQPSEAICKLAESNKSLYYVTDTALEGYELVHSEVASNGVHVYAYVYLLDNGSNVFACQEND